MVSLLRPWRHLVTQTRRRTRRTADPKRHLDRIVERALADHDRLRRQALDRVDEQQHLAIRLHGRLSAADRDLDASSERAAEIRDLTLRTLEATGAVDEARESLRLESDRLRDLVIEAAAMLEEPEQLERTDALTEVMERLSVDVGSDVQSAAEFEHRIRARFTALGLDFDEAATA